uniref:LIM and SH3 domain protein F42H10.3 n=1 Tax=Trichuris muris TaxID=70415 RepID=A0A5S6QQL9_TRIMR
MAANKCARAECGKTVYPMEELKCLDQVWHKQCFRCSACGMVLTMKNYKGYNKMPYCEAHYPKTKASVVADTPEMKRLQENTKNQSLIRYHEEYERMRGKKIEVADDPEIQRHIKNTQIQSNVIYHGELDKKQTMERIRPPIEETATAISTAGAPTIAPQVTSTTTTARGPTVPQAAPAKQTPTKNFVSPYSAKMQQTSTLIYSSERGGKVTPQSRTVGSIDNYDPMNGQWGSIVNSNRNIKSPTAKITSNAYPGQAPNAPMTQTSSQRRSGGGSGLVVRALYDYNAADSDEVTFKEGDLIVNCQSVDQGWMTGTVQRTGKWGMLPANYVERVH